jgi:hypothetical protein
MGLKVILNDESVSVARAWVSSRHRLGSLICY